MADLDQILEQMIDDIWYLYDVDKDGFLDRDETRKFACEVIGSKHRTYTKEEFEFIFNEFDTDRSGTLQKSEMCAFIKRATGLDY